MTHTSTDFKLDFYESSPVSFIPSPDQHGYSDDQNQSSEFTVSATAPTASDSQNTATSTTVPRMSRNDHRPRGFGRGSRAGRGETYSRTNEEGNNETGRRSRPRGNRGQRGRGRGGRQNRGRGRGNGRSGGSVENQAEEDGEEVYRPTISQSTSIEKSEQYHKKSRKNKGSERRSPPVEGLSGSRGGGRGGRSGGGGGGRNSRSELPSLTHEDPRYLLNFRFAPSSAHQEVRRPKMKKMPVFRKETFVQANYHFLLSPGEHIQSLANPDHSVDWSCVELVYFPVSSTVQCPICLEPPIAAKITKCGHIFCAPCILHYLSLGDKNWSRCPLCFESVYQNALKSLVVRFHTHYKDNSVVEFQLIRRLKGSIIPIECGGGQEKEKEKEKAAALTIKGYPIPYAQAHALARFARITVTSGITDVVNREKEELLRALKESENDAEHALFIKMALSELTRRYEEWGERWGHPKDVADSQEMTSASDSSCVQLEKDAWDGGNDVDEKQDSPSPQKEKKLNPQAPVFNPSKDNSPDKNYDNDYDGVQSSADESYYFYQAADGQQLFLHSLNFRCLLHEFKSVENFPPVIRGRIVEIAPYVQSENNRKKFRFLNHLPLTCDFTIALVDLSDTLSNETLRRFSRELTAYQRQQNYRHQEEERQKREDRNAKNCKGSPLLAEYAEYGFDLDGLSLDPSPDERVAISSSSTASFPHLPGADSSAPAGGLGFSPDAQNRLKQQRDEADKKAHYEQGSGWAGVAGRGMGVWAPLPSTPTPSPPSSTTKPPTSTTAWGTRAPIAMPMRKKTPSTSSTNNNQRRRPQTGEDNDDEIDSEFLPPTQSTWTLSLPNLSSRTKSTTSTSSASSPSLTSSSVETIPSNPISVSSELNTTPISPSPNTKKKTKTMLLSSSSRRAYRN